MLPARNVYGGWPASGEIDIMEGRGNVNYNHVEGGLDHYGSTLHWGVDWSKNRYQLTHEVHKHSTLLSEEFHTYGLHWTAERLYTYFDDPSNIVLDVDLTEQSFYKRGNFSSNYQNPWRFAANQNAAPFDERFYLIINLAVGGTGGYFDDSVTGKPWSDRGGNAFRDFYNKKDEWFKTWDNPDADLVIDSVKIWQK
jgi:beta-glucanase (GH16 family)